MARQPGSTRAARRPCRFQSYVPDPLVGQEVAVSAQLAADLVDVETLARRLNTSGPALNLEPMARFLLRAEAVASSNIEGLQVNVRRLARSEAEARECWATTDDTAASLSRAAARPGRSA